MVNIGENVDLEALCEYHCTALLPKSRVACFTHVEIDCAVGSNSRASSSGVRQDRTRFNSFREQRHPLSSTPLVYLTTARERLQRMSSDGRDDLLRGYNSCESLIGETRRCSGGLIIRVSSIHG